MSLIQGKKKEIESIWKFESFLPKHSQTCINDSGIIKVASIFGDLFQGFVNSNGWPIRPMGSHGFDNIRHTDNAGLQKDVITPNPLWVAGSINTLMMLQNNLSDGPGKLDFLQDVITGLGMGLNQTDLDIA